MANTPKPLDTRGLTADAILRAALNTPPPAHDPPPPRAKHKKAIRKKTAKKDR